MDFRHKYPKKSQTGFLILCIIELLLPARTHSLFTACFTFSTIFAFPIWSSQVMKANWETCDGCMLWNYLMGDKSFLVQWIPLHLSKRMEIKLKIVNILAKLIQGEKTFILTEKRRVQKFCEHNFLEFPAFFSLSQKSFEIDVTCDSTSVSAKFIFHFHPFSAEQFPFFMKNKWYRFWKCATFSNGMSATHDSMYAAMVCM